MPKSPQHGAIQSRLDVDDVEMPQLADNDARNGKNVLNAAQQRRNQYDQLPDATRFGS